MIVQAMERSGEGREGRGGGERAKHERERKKRGDIQTKRREEKSENGGEGETMRRSSSIVTNPSLSLSISRMTDRICSGVRVTPSTEFAIRVNSSCER